MTIEQMKSWLEALEAGDWYIGQLEPFVYSPDDTATHEERAKVQTAITALRTAIESAEKQEPVAWMDGYRNIYSLEEKAAGCEDAVIPLVPVIQHWSDYAVHNEPAYPKGDCDCGGYTTPPAAQPAYTKEDLDRAFSAGLVEGEKLAIEAPAAPVQEPDLTEIPMIMTCTKCGAFGEAMLTLETQPAQKPVNVTSKMVQAFLYAAGRHFPWGGSDPAIEDGIKAALEAMPTPPAAQRQWVGLTDAEILEVLCIWPDPDDDPDDYTEDIREARAIEAKLREKNGGN